MTAPDPAGDGAARALVSALEDAGLGPSDVGFICAHGTGTDLNDRAEALALRSTFGAALERIPVTATKACVGHLLGSAGAIEAVATVLMLVHQRVHPTPSTEEPDPSLGLDLVLGAPRPIRAPTVGVSLNLAFGGCNGALVFSSPGAVRPRP
jgi:3-oxoacyl-[acyl-carrier-protein] synthase II